MNGYVSKLLDNIERLVKSGADVGPLIDSAKSQVENNHDANQDEWDNLDAAVADLPPEEGAKAGDYSSSGVEVGTAGNQQYVSGAEPGDLTNPIGYPGTDQDQDRPGAPKKTVPGQKLTK